MRKLGWAVLGMAALAATGYLLLRDEAPGSAGGANTAAADGERDRTTGAAAAGPALESSGETRPGDPAVAESPAGRGEVAIAKVADPLAVLADSPVGRVDYQERSIVEVLAELEESVGVRIEIEAVVLDQWKREGEVVSLAADGLSARQLLDLICMMRSVRYEAVDGRIVVKRL